MLTFWSNGKAFAYFCLLSKYCITQCKTFPLPTSSPTPQVLVMVYDSLQDDKQESSRLQKAFRVTLQKCLLGAVIMATGSRAIYYTLISFIPVKWADIILNLYYPALLTAFSLLICFWAEVRT